VNYNLATKTGMKNSVDWLNQCLSRIKDGGAWLVPRSGTCFTVNHGEKSAIKTVSTLPDQSLDKVFVAAGWKVVEKNLPNDLANAK
jgi:hypothetical protein